MTPGSVRAFLAALFALPLTEAECAIYQHHTGRAEVPTMPFKEAALVVGRRGGKSRMLALVATHGIDLSLFRAMGGSGLINFDGTCKDDSGLIGVSFECRREVTERFGIGQRFSPHKPSRLWKSIYLLVAVQPGWDVRHIS